VKKPAKKTVPKKAPTKKPAKTSSASSKKSTAKAPASAASSKKPSAVKSVPSKASPKKSAATRKREPKPNEVTSIANETAQPDATLNSDSTQIAEQQSHSGASTRRRKLFAQSETPTNSEATEVETLDGEPERTAVEMEDVTEAENPRARKGKNNPPPIDLESDATRDAFRGLVNRAKGLLDTIDDIAKEGRETKAELKGVRAEAKGVGFDIRTFDEVVRRERLAEAERMAEEEFESQVSMYERWIRGL
jgi:uncharacterized protein (UPF0335 family)